MSASVVAAFACAVAAAAGTGMLVGRCIRLPRLDLIAWACVLAALAVALVALALGADRGYQSATFRVVQFGAQLIAPLWLAWGLTELAAKSVPVRFASKLVTMALTVVTGVVLVTDPLSPTPFSKAWPSASKHYQIIPRSLLSLIAVVTLIVVVIALVTSLLRLRADPTWRRPAIAVTAASIAAVLILGLRLSLPANGAYLALIVACTALTWFAGVWAAKVDLVELHEEIPRRRADRRGPAEPAWRRGSADDEAFGDSYPRGAENGDRGQYKHDDWYRPAIGSPASGGFPPDGSHLPGEGYPRGESHPVGEEYPPHEGDPASEGYPVGEEYLPNEGYLPSDGYPPGLPGDGYPSSRGYLPGEEYPPSQAYPPGEEYPANGGYPPDEGYAPDEGYPPGRGYPPNGASAVNGGEGTAALSDADRTGVWRPRTLGDPAR